MSKISFAELPDGFDAEEIQRKYMDAVCAAFAAPTELIDPDAHRWAKEISERSVFGYDEALRIVLACKKHNFKAVVQRLIELANCGVSASDIVWLIENGGESHD